MDTQARQPEAVEPQTQDFTPPEKISDQSAYKFSVDVWQDTKSPLSIAAAVIPERTSKFLPELILTNASITDRDIDRSDAGARLTEIINTNKQKHDTRSGITLDQRTALDIQRFIRNELRSGSSPESLAKLLKTMPGPWAVQLAKDAKGLDQFVVAKADAKGAMRDFAFVRTGDVSVGDNKPETLLQTGARLAERFDVLRENPALLKSYIQGIADFAKRLPEGEARNQFIRGINERLQANPQTKHFEIQIQKDNTGKDASLALVDKSNSGMLGELNKVEKPLVTASKESEDALRRLFASRQAVVSRERPADIEKFSAQLIERIKTYDAKQPQSVLPEFIAFAKNINGQDFAKLSKAFNLALQAEARLNPDIDLKDLALRFNTGLKEFGKYSVQTVRLQDGQSAIVLKSGERLIAGLPQNVIDASRQSQKTARDYSQFIESLKSIGADPKNPISLGEPFAKLAKNIDLNKFPQLGDVLREALIKSLEQGIKTNPNADPKEMVAAFNKSLEAQGIKDLRIDLKNGKIELTQVKDKQEKVIAQIDSREFMPPEKLFAQSVKDAKSDAQRIIALQDAIRTIRATEAGRNLKPEEIVNQLNQALKVEKIDGISLRFDSKSQQIQLHKKDGNQEKLVGKINITDLAKNPAQETMPELAARIAAPMSVMTPKEYQDYWNQVVSDLAKMPKGFQEDFVKALNSEFAKRPDTQALSVQFNQNKDGLKLVSTLEGNTANLAEAKFSDASARTQLQKSDALLKKTFPERTLAQLDSPRKRELALQLVTSKDPREQLVAARELAALNVKNIKFIDDGGKERNLNISVKGIGKSGSYVHVFGNDDNGVSRIVLRGISRPDGSIRQEIGRNGKPAEFYGDIWKNKVGQKSYLTGAQDKLLASVTIPGNPQESHLKFNLPLIAPAEIPRHREVTVVRPTVQGLPFDVERAVKGLSDAGVGNLDGLGKDKYSFESVKRQLQEYSKEQLEQIKQAFKQKHNLDLEKALAQTFSGPQVVELQQLLKGNYDSVTVVMTALANLNQTFFNYQLMKVLRDTFAHKTREEILQMDAQFKERNGGKSMFDVLREQVKGDPVNKEFLDTYFKGVDKRQDTDIVKLAKIAADFGDIELFKEAFRNSSPDARKLFKSTYPNDLTSITFGSRDNFRIANEILDKGEVSVATEIYLQSGILSSTQRGVDAAIDKMTLEQRKSYFAGKAFEQKSPEEIAKLTGADKENWLYYKSIKEQMKDAPLTYTAWKVARWEDRIKYGKEGSLITKLLEHQGNIYNSFADTIISTSIDNMSEADFKRAQDPLLGKEFRQQVEQALRVVGKSSDAIAQIMKAYDSKIGLSKIEPWTIDPKVTFENSTSRSTLEAINQKLGYFMPDRAGILEAILKMSKTEQAQFLQKEPPSKFRTELLNVINTTWSLTDEDRKSALRILSRLDETKELKADLLDEITILAAKGAKTSEFVKVLEKAFQDPELLTRINKNDALRQEYVNLLRYSVPYEDYFKYIEPYLNTGKLDFKTKATLFDNFFWSHDDVQGVLDAVKGATKQDRADIVKNADSILPFLTDEQRKLVVKVAKQDGEIKPEDKLRAAILTGKADLVRQTAEAMKPEERILARSAYEKEFGTQLLTDLIRVGKFDAQMATRLFERPKSTEQRFIDVQDEFSARMGGFSEWFVNLYDGSGSQAYNRMNEVVDALSKAKLLHTDLSEEDQKRLFDGVRNVLENWRQSRNAGAEVAADLVIMAGAIILSLPSGGASLSALAATSVGRAIIKTLLKNGATRLATEAAIAAALRPGIKELIMQEDYDLFSKEGGADAVIGALSLLLMKVGPQELAKVTGLFSKPANALSQEFGQAAVRTGDKIAEEFIRRAGLSSERAIADLSQRSLPAVIKASEKVFEQEVRQFLIKSLVDGGKISAKELAEKLASNPAFRKLVEDQINAKISHFGKEAILKGIPIEKFTAKYLSDPRFIRELETIVESGLKEALKDLSKLSLIGQRQLLQTSTGALTGGFDGFARGITQWDQSLSPEENIHNILLQTSTATVLGGVFTTVISAPGNIYKAARTGDKVPLRQIPFNKVEPEGQKLIPETQKLTPEREVSTPDRFEILRRSLDAKQARRVESVKANLTTEQANVLSKEHIDILAQNYSKVPKDIITKISPDDLLTIVKATEKLQKELVLPASDYTAALIKNPKLGSWNLEHASVLKTEQLYSVLRNWEKLTDAQRALSPDQLMTEIRKLYPKAEIPGPQRRLRLEGDRIINEEVPLAPKFSSKKLGDTDESQEVSFGEHKIRFKGDEGYWQIPTHKLNKSDGGPIKLHIIVNSVEDFKNVYSALFPHLAKDAELDNLLLGWKSIDPRFAIHGEDWADMIVRRRLDAQKDLKPFEQLSEKSIRNGFIFPNGIKQGGKGFTIYLNEGQDFRAIVDKLDQILVKSGTELRSSIPAEQASVDLVVGASKRIGIARQQWRLGQFGPNKIDKGAVLEDVVVTAIKRRYNIASDVSLTDDILRKFESEVGILPDSLVYSQDGRQLLLKLSRRDFKEIREVSSGNWAYVDESQAVNKHGLIDRPALYALYRKLNLEPSDLIETTTQPPEIPLRGRVDGVTKYTHSQSRVYEPEFETPTPEKLAQYRHRYVALQEASLESLFRSLDVPFEYVGELSASLRSHHVKVVDFRNQLRAFEEKLKSEGNFPPKVSSKEFFELQALKDEYILSRAHMAEQALQFNSIRRSTEKQLLTAFEAWASERGGIPPLHMLVFKGVRERNVKVTTEGWYRFGTGKMAFNENNFLNNPGRYGRYANLAKLAFHEHVHLEQDALVVRYALKSARRELGIQNADELSGAKLEELLAKANKNYADLMGYPMNRDWLEHVFRYDKKLGDISQAQESHAILVAKESKTYRRVHKDFDIWMNSAREVDSRLNHFSNSKQYQLDINVLLKELVDGTENVDAATFAKRIFGDAPIPQEILTAAKRFKERGESIYNVVDDPKIPYEQLRAILVERFENRLANLNDKIKQSWEGYSRHLFELEATGLEHQVTVYTMLKEQEEINRLLGRT